MPGPLESRPRSPGTKWPGGEKDGDLTPMPARPRAQRNLQLSPNKLWQVWAGSPLVLKSLALLYSATIEPGAYAVQPWGGRYKKRPQFQHRDQRGALEGQQASESKGM